LVSSSSSAAAGELQLLIVTCQNGSAFEKRDNAAGMALSIHCTAGSDLQASHASDQMNNEFSGAFFTATILYQIFYS
jgi:hypothetical protein